MVPQDYLQLLEAELKELVGAPYFKGEVKTHAEEAEAVLQEVIRRSGEFPPPILGQCAQALHQSARFLRGSAINQLPYEMSFALELALSDCISPQPIVTTALLEEGDFFLSSDPIRLIADYCGIPFRNNHVHIGMPALFRHRPLMLAPLYHEVGHFVDNEKNITSAVALSPSGTVIKSHQHAKEYFSDIFAACYIGESIADYLDEFAANAPESESHPATQNRVSIIRQYVAGDRDSPIIKELVDAAHKFNVDINLPKYSVVNVADSFDEMRPPALQSPSEVHGVIVEATKYLRTNNASKMDRYDLRTRINDLTEKSIRNYMVRRQWNDGSML